MTSKFISSISIPYLSRRLSQSGCSLLAFLFLTLAAHQSVAEEVVVYSSRNEHLIKGVFEAYTRETGVKVSFRTDQDAALLQRIRAEGKRTHADLLLTVDAGNLWQAAQMGILKSVQSDVLEKNIPKHLRDPEGKWYGLSVRARTLVYNKDKTHSGELSRYEDLGSDQWKGRICLRSSKKVYNQSLVAMLIAKHGEKKAFEVVQGWVNNLAAPPFADDTQVLKAVASGQCDVGIVNTYYYGRLMQSEPSLPIALFWPNQGDGGVHVNISGGGVVSHSKNPQQALRLLEWLSSENAQNLFADVNLEYPANPIVKPHADVAAWGEFNADVMPLDKAGKLQADAIRLMDRAGYR